MSGPVTDRMARDLRIQRAVGHVVALGPRVVGHVFAEMLDQAGAPPSILDALFAWRRFDRETIEAIDGARFPAPVVNLVPDPGHRRPGARRHAGAGDAR